MLVTIKRSTEYVKAQRIATGTNVPAQIEVDISPADLSVASRTAIVGWYGKYPKNLTDYFVPWYKQGWSADTERDANEALLADTEADGVTPGMVDAYIARLVQIESDARAAYDARTQREAREKQERDVATAAEHAAQNPIIDAYLAGLSPDTAGEWELSPQKHFRLPSGDIVWATHPRWAEIGAARDAMFAERDRRALDTAITQFIADPQRRPISTCHERDWDYISLGGHQHVDPTHPRWTELRTEIERRRNADARELADWIAAHGSARLQRLVAEDIEYTAVYFEERLAAERPGWAYASNLYGKSHEVRNARQEGLDLLDEARKTDPDAKLVWWVVKEDEEDDYGETKEVVAWKGYACESTFLGEDIVYGVPTEYAC